MAQTIDTITIYWDEADANAFRRDLESIVLKYGDPPQPHNQAAFDGAMARASATFAACMRTSED